MENPEQKKYVGAFLLAIGGIIMFSAKAVLVKKAYSLEIDTVTLLLLRMLFALPVYLVIAGITTWKNRDKSNLSARQMFTIIALGLAGYYLASYLDFKGLNYVSASLERLILFVYPTMVVVLNALLNRSRIPSVQITAIAITYFGVFIIFFRSSALVEHSSLAKGASLIFASALTYAFYLVGSGNLIPKIGSVRFTSYAMIISCLGVGIHYYLRNPAPLTGYSSEVYGLGLGMAVFCTVLPSFMISEAIRRIGAPKVAILGSIGPISTIIMAAVFLGERINAFQGLGTIIVISGVMLVNRQRIPETDKGSKFKAVKPRTTGLK